MSERHEPRLHGTHDPAADAAEYAFRSRRLQELPRPRRGGVLRGLVAIALFAGAFAIVAFGVREVNRRATPPAPAVAAPIAPAVEQRAVAPPPRTAPTAAARTLNTCVSAAGEKLVTDMSCPVGYTLAASREFVPDRRVAPPPRYSSPRSTPQPAAGPAFSMPAPNRESDVARQRCADAKAHEKDYRDQRGVKITYDELEWLADKVRRACADV